MHNGRATRKTTIEEDKLFLRSKFIYAKIHPNQYTHQEMPENCYVLTYYNLYKITLK